MKKLVTGIFIVVSLLRADFLISQSLNKNDDRPPYRCATQTEFDNHAKSNPALLELRKNFEARMEEFNAGNRSASPSATSSVPRVIPVVVHVLHDCGAGNISKEQILDGIRVLNEDFRRLNADAAFTPVPFQSVAADCNIEFHLAQLDPNGNCTDGVLRFETARTNYWGPRDSLKRVSSWPTNKYLNIWLVNGIKDENGTGGGTILGYAHFPWDTTHRAITDGVVIRHDRFGTIGTAAGSGNNSRVATHEVGHWLGLTHIWGDDNGACTGSDNCADTPNSSDQIFGCPGGSASTATFPLYDGCTSSGNGIMYMNYMDYADGSCMNLFTLNQKGRMDGVFNVYRGNLISNSNLIATGTDGTTAVVCAPKAKACVGYGQYVCQHNAVTFHSSSYNVDTLSYSWQFPGGNPSTSTDESPVIIYDTVGIFGFSLTVTSSGGSDSIYYNNAVSVSGPAATIIPSTLSTMEDFELASSFPGDGLISNPDQGITWQRVTNAGYSGVASLYMNNYSNDSGHVDQYITPAYDLSNLVGVQLKFRLANAQRTSVSYDVLNVYVSTDCGSSWGPPRRSLSGAALATVGVLGTPFTPVNTSQWRLTTVNPSAPGATNLRFMFENISGHGNNTYIDDINITALQVVGIAETEFEAAGFHVYPNPASRLATVNYNLATPGFVALSVLDPLGREVQTLVLDKKELGIHEIHLDLSTLGKGIYFLNLKTPNSSLTTKLIIK
jgi:PKD repeat protein